MRVVREPEQSAGAAGTEGLSIWCAARRHVDDPRGSPCGGCGPRGLAGRREAADRDRPAALWIDFGDDTFPQETGLEDAVSYTKGCYLGQEVVARIHYRGGVQRHLRRLRLNGPAEVGADLLLDGKSVGTLTSASPSLSGDELLGLAIVHKRAEIGAELDVEHAGDAVKASVLV